MLEYVTIDHGFEIRYAHEVMRVEQWGRDSVRVRCAQHAIASADVGALEAPPEPRDCPPARRDEQDGRTVRLVVGDLTVEARLDASSWPRSGSTSGGRARTSSTGSARACTRSTSGSAPTPGRGSSGWGSTRTGA